MKVNRLVWLFLLAVLAGGCGKQPSPQSSNSMVTNSVKLNLQPGTNASSETIPDWAKDDTKVFKEIKEKAEKGDSAAQYNTGVRYMTGDGVTKDVVEGFKWFLKAAEQGDVQAQYSLNFCYMTGDGVAKDVAEGIKWQRKAAEQENAHVQNNPETVEELTNYLNEVKRYPVKWYEWYRKAAEQGDAKAQFFLGNSALVGDGVTKDLPEAVKWYRKAADQGFSDAQFSLGWMYANGEGVPQDLAEAAKWIRKAAEQGEVQAQYSLGTINEFGHGVEMNYVEAVKWYRKAAEQGDVKAQSCLGNMYANGRGVEKDYVEAVKWYRKAAEQGDAKAQLNLGASYAKGDGVNKDTVQATKWYRKAAEQGEVVAQAALGARYFLGEGVPKNYMEAYKWLDIASAQDNENAKQLLSSLEQQMTAEQIAEGQRLAANFKPRKESGSDNSISPDNPTATGTGFFITDDGYLISNNHVVKDATKVRLVTSAGLIDAKVIQVDAANDLALLKAEGRFAPLPIASSRAVHLGNSVATVGFPNIGLQGFAPKLAKGEIASLSGASDDARYFQISVPVQPGNSGGALVDEHGNVVGIVSAKLNARAALAESGALPENVNYAVKSSFLLSFLESTPDVANKLKEPVTADRKFEDVVKSAQQAAVLVLVY